MYIRNPIRKTVVVLAIIGGLGTVIYAGYRLEKRDDQKRQAAFTAQHKAQNLVEATAMLKKAVDAYQKKMIRESVPFPPGKIISLGELVEGGVLSRKELESLGRVKNFSYVLLPFDAPDKALQLVLVTSQGRATINKKGEGVLYEQ